MRHWRLLIASAAIAVIVGTVIVRELTKAEATERQFETHLVSSPSGRVLYAVVDADAVYLGEARFPFPQSLDAVNGVLRKQHIRNLYIYATSDAKFGDVVRLHASVDRNLIDYCSFSYAAIPPGARKPLSGFILHGMCGPIFPL